MRSAAEFYQGMHSTEKSYSGGTYYHPSLYSCGGFKNWVQQWRGEPMRLIDVGIGRGLFFCAPRQMGRAKYGICSNMPENNQ